MKKQWSSDSEERSHRSSSLASAAAIHARLTSMAIAAPTGGSTRKHGFSWRRFLSSPFSSSSSNNSSKRSSNNHPGSSGGRKHFAGSHQGNHQQTTFSTLEMPPDSHSIHSQLNHGAGVLATTAESKSCSDAESNSLSSGRSESVQPGQHLHRGRLSTGGDNSVSSRQQGQSLPTCQECPLCLLELPPECYPGLSSCDHQACYNCLQQYLKIEITESRVNICCPHCSEPLHPTDIRMILQDEHLMAKYEEFLLRRVLVTEPDIRWCPAPDCGYAVIASGCASCPKLKCERPNCETFFCYHCKQEWHPNQTCDAARAQRALHHHHHSPNNPRSASVSFSQDSIIQRDDIKMCPCCKALIVKMDDGSCNHLTCSVCGTEFCWLCMKEISDLHYLSPSGCTFWGKKPWSRKKKILWQLGMLVGAPVGIALIAGIAVPAIIIGVPVWVGRKLYAKYNRQNSNKHKRNIVVTSGVMASVLVSPILAGIAVGIGVPILLAYVYGVVPISLCRSGGCGVTTSASGVRIEFDEENDIGMGNSLAADGVSVDTAASHRGVVNPSIGEVSFGMSTSVSLGSGCHLERVGFIREEERELSDRESASNTAIAGHSLTGSIASASITGGPPISNSTVAAAMVAPTLQTPSSGVANTTLTMGPASLVAMAPAVTNIHPGFLANGITNGAPHKLEVQVDVSSTSVKRLSVSSETPSAAASLTENSSSVATDNEHCPNN